MSTGVGTQDSVGDPLLCVVIATGMFMAVAPDVLRLLWLIGVAVGAVVWRQHAKRTAQRERGQG